MLWIINVSIKIILREAKNGFLAWDQIGDLEYKSPSISVSYCSVLNLPKGRPANQASKSNGEFIEEAINVVTL